MPRLLLIRHGENEFSRKGRLAGRLPDIHLNKRGQEQSQVLAEALHHLPIKALYTSPLDRAVETARPICKALGLTMQREQGLIESDVGRWEGKSVRRLAFSKEWRVVQHSPSRARHPGGESFVQTQARIISTLEAICIQYRSNELVACVFHSDPIKLAVAHFIGLPLDHFQRLSCDTASVTLLAINPNQAQLIWLNRRPPFEALPVK